MMQPTPREMTMLEGLRHAKSNKELAADLGIGEGTVKLYMSRMYAKFGAKNRVDLALWAERREIFRDLRA